MSSTVSTTYGISFDTDSVPDLPDGIEERHNCLVAIDDLDLISIGGSNHPDQVLRFTMGASEWEYLNSPQVGRDGSGCGLVSRC